jgi:hypothetical protein
MSGKLALQWRRDYFIRGGSEPFGGFLNNGEALTVESDRGQNGNYRDGHRVHLVSQLVVFRID